MYSCTCRRKLADFRLTLGTEKANSAKRAGAETRSAKTKRKESNFCTEGTDWEMQRCPNQNLTIFALLWSGDPGGSVVRGLPDIMSTSERGMEIIGKAAIVRQVEFYNI